MAGLQELMTLLDKRSYSNLAVARRLSIARGDYSIIIVSTLTNTSSLSSKGMLSLQSYMKHIPRTLLREIRN